MLPYENEAFLEILSEDGLTVFAKGLGLERIFLNLLNIYSDPGNLVFVIGARDDEAKYFCYQLEKTKNVTELPKIITSSYSINDRRSVYMQGGVLFITSRILVVDLLTDRVPADLVTGILVYRAHKVIESAQEAFILRLYREKNKTGFIKAFTDSPTAFTSNFCQVERTMRHLFVRKLNLWPRIRVNVVDSLDKKQPNVVEIQVNLSTRATAIQMSLLSVMSICIKELKQCNPHLETDELTVENTLSNSFDKLVRMQLEPVWNELSGKSKQLVSDLRNLASLMMSLTQHDCVTFYNSIYSLRGSEKTFRNSNWLFLDEAQAIFLNAQQRVFGVENEKEMLYEENPKWAALNAVLKEIEDELAGRKENVLLLAQDETTCTRIREYLRDGSRVSLARLFDKMSKVHRWNKKGTVDKEEPDDKPEHTLTLTQMFEEKNICCAVETTNNFHMFVEPFKIHSEQFHLPRVVEELKPQYVIMYDANITCVRQLEVYQASNPSIPVTVYFLIYSGSVEEQRYLTTLRKEREAFEFLIKEKATMAVPEEREGRMDNNHPDLIRDPRPANQTVNPENTRKGGIQSSEENKSETRRIIVDMREFNSDLPSLIHRRGINVVPVTLSIGDYVLSPNMCVERKSVSDLISSLNSGRMHNQMVAMSRKYDTPMLLIEFDHTKGFGIHNKGYMSHDISAHDIASKLAMLTFHFPQLRIMWCESSYAAAELFDELKIGKAEPNEQVQEDPSEVAAIEKYNHAAQDFILKLPGVNSINSFALMNQTRNITELSNYTVEQIDDIIKNSANSQMLWKSLHLPTEKLSTSSKEKVCKSRWKRK